MVEVVGDGVGASVQALVDQVLSKLHDAVLDRGRGGVGAGTGTARAGLQPGLALGVVAAEQFVDPAAGELIGAGHRAGRGAPGAGRGDHNTGPWKPGHLPPEGGSKSRGKGGTMWRNKKQPRGT